jgi:hypothetical protein
MSHDQRVGQILTGIAKEKTVGHNHPDQTFKNKIHLLKYQGKKLNNNFFKNKYWTFGIVIIVLTVACSYYLLFDPGLQKADDKGLVTHLNQTAQPYYFSGVPQSLSSTGKASQTNNGITVKLDWVYGDAIRIAWQLSISGLSIPQGSQLSDFVCDPYLTNDEGVDLNQNGHFTQNVNDQNGEQFSISYISYQNIDAEKIHNLHVNLDLTVGPCGPEGIPHKRSDFPPTPVPLIGTFHLAFDIPIHNGVTITQNQTIKKNGVTMSLEQIRFAPSYTIVRLCYETPQIADIKGNTNQINSDDWNLYEITLKTSDGLEIPRDFFYSPGKVSYSPPPKVFCENIGFSSPVDPKEKLILTIPEMEARESVEVFLDGEVQKFAHENLALQGIEVDFVFYGSKIWNIIRKPDGMSDAQVDQVVYKLLTHKIKGPWEFTIN